jgi:Mg-chelatase subunit ChlI
MHWKFQFYSILAAVCFFAAPLRAQDNPLNDPDLKEMLKEAEKMQKEGGELQKQNPNSADTKKKLAEMEAQAKEEVARQEQEEKREKDKLQAALKKQLDAPVRSRYPIGHRLHPNSRPPGCQQEKSWMTK